MKGIIYSLMFTLLTNNVKIAYAESTLYELKRMQPIYSYDSYLISDHIIVFIRLGLAVLTIVVAVIFFCGNIRWKYKKNTRRDRYL